MPIISQIENPRIEASLFRRVFRSSETLAIDSGAAIHVAPLTYAEDYRLLLPLSDEEKQYRLQLADGTPIPVYGERCIWYEMVEGVICFLSFLICQVGFPILYLRQLKRCKAIFNDDDDGRHRLIYKD